MGSVERHSSAMRTSILLGVFCIILLGLLEPGECRASGPAKRDVEAVEATTTGLVRDVEENSDEYSDEDSDEDSEEDSDEDSDESKSSEESNESSSSSEESVESSSSSSSS